MMFDIDETFSAIRHELGAAERKFPDGFHSPHEGWAVIREELDELWDLVRADIAQDGKAEKECIQIAAMAIRYIKCLTATSDDLEGDLFEGRTDER